MFSKTFRERIIKNFKKIGFKNFQGKIRKTFREKKFVTSGNWQKKIIAVSMRKNSVCWKIARECQNFKNSLCPKKLFEISNFRGKKFETSKTAKKNSKTSRKFQKTALKVWKCCKKNPLTAEMILACHGKKVQKWCHLDKKVVF